MNNSVKKLFDIAKTQNIKRVTEDSMKKLGFTDIEIQEIIKEFVTNQPKKIWKCGDCPNCGSGVDSSYNNFDKTHFFTCDCPHDFYGSEAENTHALISLT